MPAFISASPGGSTTQLQYNNAGAFGAADLYWTADTLSQYRSTTSQTWRLYNTRTDASNYERGQLSWAANVFRVETVAAGTGTKRPFLITDNNSAKVWSDTAGDLHLGGKFVIGIGETTRWRFDLANAARPLAPVVTNAYDLGSATKVIRRSYIEIINSLKSAATDPTTTQFPNDKDWGLHKNTVTGIVYLAINDGSTIKKIALA